MIIKFLNNLFFLLIFLSLINCSTLNNLTKIEPVKNQKLVELKLPFNSANFVSDGNTFYVIENAKGANLSVIKNMVQMQAKVNLANSIKFFIRSITEQSQFGSENQTQLSFQQKSISFVNQSIEKIVLIDSKTFRDTQTGLYEFWAVFSLEINDVKNLNSKQTIIDVKQYNELIKKNIKIDTKLIADEKTSSNEYLTEGTANNNSESLRNMIEIESKSYIGVPYVWGGDNPSEGFDCSGFVRWVYKKSLNKLIPRTTSDHKIMFKNIIKFKIDDSKKGDLIYFNTIPGRDISHVGIYLGNGKFIHAPNEREKVKIDKLDGYWLENYVGYVSVNDFKK